MAANEATFNSVPEAVSVAPGKGQIWTGRVLAGLTVAFMVFDAVGKLMRPKQVVDASAQLGYAAHTLPGIGIALLVCTLLYVIPRTAVLGAAVLTGYLGGAVASMVRVGAPTFELIFPVLFAIVIWGSLWLRMPRLRGLFPIVR